MKNEASLPAQPFFVRPAFVRLHPILSLGGFYICCYLPFQVSTKPSGAQVLLMLLLAALVYGLIMTAVCLITASHRRKQTEETPYVSQYTKK